MSTVTVPAAFRAFVDDAAIYPPGLMPLPDAVAAHAAHLAADHRDLVGPLVVGGALLADLAALVDVERFPNGLRVSVVVPSADDVAVTVDAVAASGSLVLAGLEVRLDPTRPLAEQVDAVAAVERHGAVAFVEVPRPGHADWPAVADVAAAHGLRLKLRTGGTEATAFPTDAEVATWIVDAVARDVPFKCTAGLHHAVRHTATATGFEHHGYLNLLVATARARAGADVVEVTGVVAERSPRVLADLVAADPGVAEARALFTSYGSCSVLEPLDDLEALDLISVRKAHA